MRRTLGLLLLAGAASAAPAESGARWADGSSIQAPRDLAALARWPRLAGRRWAGASIWCNRLQDWRLREGRLSTYDLSGLPLRTAHLVTHQLTDRHEPFRMAVLVHD
jgi:hypothetical protein